MEWWLEPSQSYASKKDQCSLGRQAPQCNKEAGRGRGMGAEKSLMILDGRIESSVEAVTKNKARRSTECVSLSVVEGSLKPYTMTTLSTRPNAPVSTYHVKKNGDASRWLHSHGTKCPNVPEPLPYVQEWWRCGLRCCPESKELYLFDDECARKPPLKNEVVCFPDMKKVKNVRTSCTPDLFVLGCIPFC